MSENYVSKVLSVARGQVGYLEKKSNSNLDSKTANAGYNNYTKYARDFDQTYPNFYNGRKQSVAWCDIFVDWCMVTAYGVDEARKLLGQPLKSCGAGCSWSMRHYKNIGCFYSKNPKAGDQIFFYNSKLNDIAHTGLVVKVDGTYVYTIEGNTSSSEGVVANGGAVAEKKYKLSYNRIAGYGRPKYDKEPVKEVVETKPITSNKPTTSTSKFSKDIQNWQKAAMYDGYKFPKYGADGDWGSECKAVAKVAICQKPKIVGRYKNKNLTKFLQKKLGFTGKDVDGKFWTKTRNAVIKFQKSKGLEADGVVGYDTWKALLGVK
jgi:hypothetical protein